MRYYLTSLLIMIYVVLTGCEGDKKDNSGSSVTPDLKIKSGYICGWGIGLDTVVITFDNIEYTKYIPQVSDEPRVMKKRKLKPGEWDEILSYLNIESFIKLKYNTCNVCVDGCDEWISVESDSVEHKITYDYKMKINSISELQNIFLELRREFNSE